MKEKQKFKYVIGWRNSEFLQRIICSRKYSRLAENRLKAHFSHYFFADNSHVAEFLFSGFASRMQAKLPSACQ